MCVISFGLDRPSWLSLTVVPAREDAEALELMSYEFLSEDEQRRALELEIEDATAPRPD